MLHGYVQVKQLPCSALEVAAFLCITVSTQIQDEDPPLHSTQEKSPSFGVQIQAAREQVAAGPDLQLGPQLLPAPLSPTPILPTYHLPPNTYPLALTTCPSATAFPAAAVG